jgi:hypothetical protein
VLDPAPLLAELAGIEQELPLRERLTTVTLVLQRRLTRVINLLTAVGLPRPPDDLEAHRAKVRPTNDMIHRAVIELLQPDRDAFNCSVGEAARVLRLLVFAGTHPLITDGDPLSAETIVSVLLDGIRRHQDRDDS